MPMTVSELIAILQEYPQNAKITLNDKEVSLSIWNCPLSNRVNIVVKEDF